MASFTEGGVVTFDTPVNGVVGLIPPDWGYYFDGRLDLLDEAGEWFYDKSGGKIYIYAPGGLDPNNLTVEGAYYEYGIRIFWQPDNVSVSDLDFRQQTLDGANVNQCDNVTIRNNHFSLAKRSGVNME